MKALCIRAQAKWHIFKVKYQDTCDRNLHNSAETSIDMEIVLSAHKSALIITRNSPICVYSRNATEFYRKYLNRFINKTDSRRLTQMATSWSYL